MNNKLQELQIDLMNDSKLEADEFVIKYSQRIRDILEDKITEDPMIDCLFDLIKTMEVFEKGSGKGGEYILGNYIYNKLKNARYNSSN